MPACLGWLLTGRCVHLSQEGCLVLRVHSNGDEWSLQQIDRPAYVHYCRHDRIHGIYSSAHALWGSEISSAACRIAARQFRSVRGADDNRCLQQG